MRWLKILSVVVLAAVAVALLPWLIPAKSSLPSFAAASVSILDFREQKEATVSLDSSQREQLVRLFRGVARDRNPKKWVVFGTVRLFDEKGQEVSMIDVFSNSSGAGPFRIGEHYFLGYDQKAFREMLGFQGSSDLPR